MFGRRVDERPFDAVGFGLRHDLLDAAARSVAQLRLGVPRSLMPQTDRALRIAIDQHAAPRRAIGMGGQSAVSVLLPEPPLREAKTMTSCAPLIRCVNLA